MLAGTARSSSASTEAAPDHAEHDLTIGVGEAEVAADELVVVLQGRETGAGR